MKYVNLIGLLFLPAFLAAQPAANKSVSGANSSDVSSIDAIVQALYDAISGPAGEKRDSLRIASLFKPGADVMPVYTTGKGEILTIVEPVDDFYKGISQFTAKQGFFEQEIGRVTEQYGLIAHVFSAYESRFNKTDPKPFQRGINSLQLMHDGKRWWIMNIAYTPETPEKPIPDKYLKMQ